MKPNKSRRVGGLGLALAGPAAAQDKFPSKPIKIVVPFGPGSATDIVIRIVGEQMRQILGQNVLVENKPGAFGIIAIEEMAGARPDGYTLQVGNPGTNVLTPLIYKSKFKIDYDKDVVMLTRLGEVPLVLVATTKNFAPKTYAEFIALAKSQPGKVRYASVGVGSNNHYDTEAFAKWAGIELNHIPNKGGGAAITNDLVSGDSQVGFVNAASSAGVVKGGMLKVLAVMADERLPEYPDTPTLKELGYSVGQGTVVGLVCAGAGAARGARNAAQGDRAGAPIRAGAERFQEADDQGGPQRSRSRMRGPGPWPRRRTGRRSPRR